MSSDIETIIPSACIGSADRRQFIQAITLAGLAGLTSTSVAAAAQGSAGAPPKAIPMGTLGAAGAGPDRPKIAMLVHPKMVMLDLIGPLTVFNMMRCEIHLVWKTLDPVMTELGVPVIPSTRLADCPQDLDVLFAPGGLDGTVDMINDPEVVQFFADRGRTARYVTSDCTGSLLLGAAGLLKGYRAASNWITTDQLAMFGAIPVNDRVAIDRNRITGGGVTAGIDFGLTIAEMLRSRQDAEMIQLIIQYAPEPPFNSGTPETAPKALVDLAISRRSAAVERSRQAVKAAAERLKI